jgi:magnesium transporter
MDLIQFKSLTWHNLVSPSEGDLNELKDKYGFHELDIEDCMSEHERPKIDEYDDYLFLVLHIPYYQKGSKRILNAEIHMFIGDGYLITLHDGNLQVLNTFWDEIMGSEDAKDKYMSQGAGLFLYELINAFFESSFPLIDNINRKIKKLEGNIFEEEDEEKTLRVILELKRGIISMRRILLPQRTVVASLEHKSKKFIAENLDVYFDDVQDAIEQQWSMLETAKEVIGALQELHESWIQNKTNRIIRILTVFSVTMLPLTVITGIFGMNVDLPYSHDPWAFIGISAILFLILIGALAYFGWRKWL